MKIVSAGAGEVGRELARSFGDRRNNMTVVERSAGLLDRLRDRLEVMTVTGDCAVVGILKRALGQTTDLFIAATRDDAANVLACSIARHFKVPMTICRLGCTDFFSDGDAWTPAALGIDHMIFPEAECVTQIRHALEHQAVVERIVLSYPDAECTGLRVSPRSSLVGCPLHDFPEPALLARVRIVAIVRQQRLVTLHGSTVFGTGDEVYVAGPRAAVAALHERFWPGHSSTGPVVVAGVNTLSRRLVLELCDLGLNVRVIEPSETTAAAFLDDLGRRALLIRGSSTDSDVLEEAGVKNCRAFISMLDDDEDNILGSILAKQHGARKVITVTHKAEYVGIVPAMAAIDCGFSPRLAAVNSVLNVLCTDEVRVQAVLNRTRAYVYEFRVQPGAPFCGRRLADCQMSEAAVFALIVRRAESLVPTGEVILEAGDRVVTVSTPETARDLEKPLTRRSFLR